MADRSWLMGMREEEQNSSLVLRTLVTLTFLASKVQTPPLRENETASQVQGLMDIMAFPFS